MKKNLFLNLYLVILIFFIIPFSNAENIQKNDLIYKGAFRLPSEDTNEYQWDYGGYALAFNPNGDSASNDNYPGSLFSTGLDARPNNADKKKISEFSIPVPVISTNLNDLNRAATMQGFGDITGGFYDIVLDGQSLNTMRGLTYLEAQPGQNSGKLYWSFWSAYNVAQDNLASQGYSDLTIANPNAQGVWKLEDYHSKYVSGYLFDIPKDWADDHINGKYIATGISREGGTYSRGPVLFSIAPYDYTNNNPPSNGELPTTPLIFYDDEHDTYPNYVRNDIWRGGSWITTQNKEAVAFVGSKCIGEVCYGTGGVNGDCPDPCNSYKGYHCYPTEPQMVLYDTSDLADVAKGNKNPWEIYPYSEIDLREIIPSYSECTKTEGMTFDRENGKLYLVHSGGDSPAPLIHVIEIDDESNGNSNQNLKAFPGAQGYGAYTIGGRGGEVIKVTNLNDDGPGSLREAVEAQGPRIVVFEVSGIINLESTLFIDEPYLTIAGQTSPGGILVASSQTTVATHDVIIQHMRFRVGTKNVIYKKDNDGDIICSSYQDNCGRGDIVSCIDEVINPNKHPNPIVLRNDGYDECAESNSAYVGANPETLDSFSIFGEYWGGNEAYNIMIDHCSFSWGVDETFSTGGGVTNTTVQWSIVSEGLSNAGHPKGQHSKGLLVSGKYENPNTVSVHHNYIAHNTDRSPMLSSPAGVDTTVDAVNNVIYNWYGGLAPMTCGTAKTNWVHNYAKQGPRSNDYSFEVQYSDPVDVEENIYVEGNIGSTRLSQSEPQWNVGVDWHNELLDESYRKFSRWDTPQIVTTEMTYGYALEILEDVGATKPFRDNVDSRVIADFDAGTGTIIANIYYPDDYPTFQNLAAPTDSDDDGMADDWENDHELNTNSDDSALDKDNDGYTNIEEYLYFLSSGETIVMPICVHVADNNPCNEEISSTELFAYIEKWIDGEVSVNDLFEVIDLWKNY